MKKLISTMIIAAFAFILGSQSAFAAVNPKLAKNWKITVVDSGCILINPDQRPTRFAATAFYLEEGLTAKRANQLGIEWMLDALADWPELKIGDPEIDSDGAVNVSGKDTTGSEHMAFSMAVNEIEGYVFLNYQLYKGKINPPGAKFISALRDRCWAELGR